MSVYTLTVVLAVGLFLFDFQNVLAWSDRRVLGPHFERDFDFTIVVPAYGHPRYFEDRAHLLQYQANVLVAIDVGEPVMAEFADQLEAEGWRVSRKRLPKPSPPAMIEAVLGEVTTTYLMRMDADTRLLEDVPRYIAAMRRDGADVCSTKVHVRNPRTVVERFQELEYRMAMLSRHYRPWLTSGACTVAKTTAWRAIFAQHSMWFPGEDIETGRVALALKLRVRHLRLHVETDAPNTWRALFRQRRLWWAGNFRHIIVNFDKNALQLPVVTFYYVVLVYVGFYFKWWTFVCEISPFVLVEALLTIFVIYALITLIANLKVASPGILVYPPYALAQAILMPLVGAVYYVVLARRQGRLGRYGIGYRRRALAQAG
jgi:cellulose synthase/poly-beta-1,6-N-acetylglucosamine synthase-like glycosyltransferase